MARTQIRNDSGNDDNVEDEPPLPVTMSKKVTNEPHLPFDLGDKESKKPIKNETTVLRRGLGAK